MSNAAAQSSENALVADLTNMRQAFDTYAAEHKGDFPGKKPDGKSGGASSAKAFETQLTQYSDESGKVSTTRTAQYRFGPYLRSIPSVPVGPNKGNKGVAIDAVNSPPLVTVSTEGWVYNPSTGEIIANTDAPNSTGTHAYDEY